MNKHNCLQMFCILIVLLLIFVGCGRKAAHAPSIPESPQPVSPTTLPQTTHTQESEEAPAFSYEPGSLGSYVIATPSIEAMPEELGDIPLKLPEGVTLEKVSNRQYDFIRRGHQSGGLLLVDIPEDMLDKAKDTKEDWLALGDFLWNQIMPDADPGAFPISGGGHGEFGELYGCYALVTYGGVLSHSIFRGENHCYDLWVDWGWDLNPGPMLESMAACEDIKPELNNIDFSWSIHDES